MKEEVKILLDILNIPTVNGADDEGKLAEYLADYFRKFGIESYVDRMDERHANIIAIVKGKKENAEVWNGHLDTVPYGEENHWQTDPRQAVEADGKIYARGASDMKSGLAAMVYALTHLPEKPENTIYFVGTCDEERGGLGAEEVLKKKALPSYDFLLISEPTDLRPGTTQKGCLWLKVKVSGKTGHGAYPKKGVNAIDHCYQFYFQLKEYLSHYRHPDLDISTIQLNKITGGHTINMTADSCEGCFDIRFVPALCGEQILEKATQIGETMMKATKNLDLAIEVLNHRRGFEISENEAEVQLLKEILRAKDLPTESLGIYYFSDASVLVKSGESKNVMLFGPGNPNLAHQANEYVEVKAYLQSIDIFKQMALRSRESYR